MLSDEQCRSQDQAQASWLDAITQSGLRICKVKFSSPTPEWPLNHAYRPLICIHAQRCVRIIAGVLRRARKLSYRRNPPRRNRSKLGRGTEYCKPRCPGTAITENEVLFCHVFKKFNTVLPMEYSNNVQLGQHNPGPAKSPL
jgi:hypothetical protein